MADAEDILQCLRALASPGTGRASGYPAAWLLLDLLAMLPEGNGLKREWHHNKEALADLVAAAEADEGHRLQAAARLFSEAGLCSTATRRQLADYLLLNPDACQLLLRSADYAAGRAREGRREREDAERLARAQVSIVLCMWEALGRQLAQLGTQPCPNPVALVRKLLAATQLADQAAGWASPAADPFCGLLPTHGDAMLVCFQWLEQRAGDLGAESKAALSLVVQSWAVRGSLQLQQPACAGSTKLCCQLVGYFMDAALRTLARGGRLSSSWFDVRGLIAALACICSNLAQVSDSKCF